MRAVVIVVALAGSGATSGRWKRRVRRCARRRRRASLLLLAVARDGAFWFVRMWYLPELFEGVFQTGRWPIGIYPHWLRFGVTFLVPIAFAVTVPAEAFTSRLDWQTLALAAGFAVVALRVHPLVLALRPAALLGRFGVARPGRLPRSV